MVTLDDEPDDRAPHPGPHHHCEDATAFQRAAAWVLNAVVIVAWIGFVTGLRLFAFSDAAVPADDLAAKFGGHAIGFLTLTLPAWLFLSLSEWRWGYSLGKAALGLRVVDLTGHYPTLQRALLRNGLMLAPWEIAHAAVWWSSGRPFLDSPSPAAVWALTAAGGLVLATILSTLLWSGRSIHDRISGTKVVQVGVLKPVVT